MSLPERPSSSDLEVNAGYIYWIAVERLEERDAAWLVLQYFVFGQARYEEYSIFLDEYATVGLTMVQMAREAAANDWPVVVDYYDAGTVKHVYRLRALNGARVSLRENDEVAAILAAVFKAKEQAALT